ncbi:MAG: uroporphyrinogen-III synthase [Flavobacterium sp.]|jgi:uroporphyrinogen-III synthase|uniref:uroporphyrinogen-III synthase n=1 Tax=Flavobacterium sp. TaxID=239 RepID=UPI0022CC0EBC|nr:uroporphyrinogen-III synthase [Flavobacterium sp.]MCZ8329723.1 uroporphyrinogen-III synthase [Flavobacterium sp.]
MENEIRIVSTKLLSEDQKLPLLSANVSVIDNDFITINYNTFSFEKLNDYLIFTSQNAVESVLLHKDNDRIKTKKAFCVGEKTKKLLVQNGIEVVLFSEYAAELASVICNQYSKNSFTFFSGNIRRNILPDALQLAQIKMDEIEVYQTVLTSHKIDMRHNAVLFFSPSAVESYLKENEIDNKICFCIGYTTAETLKEKTENIIIASQPKIEYVIAEVIKYYN